MRCSSTCRIGRLFVGDFIMPYLGAPFVEEGDFSGAAGCARYRATKDPSICSMATEPLTRNFAPLDAGRSSKIDLIWLREQVLTARAAAMSAAPYIRQT